LLAVVLRRRAKEGACFEIVVVELVPTAKTDAQGLLDVLTFNCGHGRARDQSARSFVPEFQVTLEVPHLFRAEIDDRYLDFNRNRIAIAVEITPRVEIVLVDRRRPADAIRPEREIDSLDDGRLSRVVVADKDGMSRQRQLSFGNPAKILDGNLYDAHGSASRSGDSHKRIGPSRFSA
jgi:hypothetical protein